MKPQRAGNLARLCLIAKHEGALKQTQFAVNCPVRRFLAAPRFDISREHVRADTLRLQSAKELLEVNVPDALRPFDCLAVDSIVREKRFVQVVHGHAVVRYGVAVCMSQNLCFELIERFAPRFRLGGLLDYPAIARELVPVIPRVFWKINSTLTALAARFCLRAFHLRLPRN